MNLKEKKPMPTHKKIILAVLAVILAAVLSFAWIFRDFLGVIVKNPEMIPYIIENWDSLSRGLNTDVDDLDNEKQANSESQSQAFADANINLSADDIENLSNAEMTEEERAKLIYDAMTAGSENAESSSDDGNDTPFGEEIGESVSGEAQPEDEKKPDTKNDNVSVKPEKPKNDVQSSAVVKPSDSEVKQENPGTLTEDEYNIKVSELVAKMYSIKADFMGKLSAFESKVISEYKALPEAQRTTATKAKIVADNMSYIIGLEAQCDAQVDAVTSELSAIMTANGKDTSLVDQIKSAYTGEKELKKAYYVSLYK